MISLSTWGAAFAGWRAVTLSTAAPQIPFLQFSQGTIDVGRDDAAVSLPEQREPLNQGMVHATSGRGPSHRTP
jgi:hypothetical protein